MKTYLRDEVKQMNKDELIDGIKKFWATVVTAEYCTNFINHVPKKK